MQVRINDSGPGGNVKQTNGSKARDGHALTEERRGSPRSIVQTRRTNGASVINVISGNDNASTKS
jgi:hypothetical protein